MSQRWLQFLEKVGTRRGTAGAQIPNPLDDPQLDNADWSYYANFDLLYHLYGPPTESPWHAYHCPTFFAGVERRRIEPRRIERSPNAAAALGSSQAPADAWNWLGPEVTGIIDLPGAEALQLAQALLIQRECQLICTFDHWPTLTRRRPKEPDSRAQSEDSGTTQATDDSSVRSWPPDDVDPHIAVDSRDILDSMATFGPEIYQRRKQMREDGSDVTAPPVWVCDSRRLGSRFMQAGEYDNRYFIDPSLLPSADTLIANGIRKTVYLRPNESDECLDDLAWWLAEMEQAGISLFRVDLDNQETWVTPRPVQTPAFSPRYSGPSFYHNKSGGFGKRIPVPGESSGSGRSRRRRRLGRAGRRTRTSSGG